MKKLIVFMVILLSITGYSVEKSVDKDLKMIIEKDVPIEVRDGTILYGNVFRPSKQGRYPVIVSVGPYGKDRLPAKFSKKAGDIRVSEYTAFEVADPAYWVPNGYAVVNVDSRGSWDSQGNMSLLSPIESRDYYDVIQWAGKSQWSNGRVATMGASYYAMTQWHVAALNPPHLKAILPWEGLTDVYRDIVYHGGVREKDFFVKWFKRVKMAKRRGSQPENILEGLEDSVLDSRFFREKNPNLREIRVPAFVGASWSNHGLHSRGSIEGYKNISSEDKWIYIHGGKNWEVFYSEEVLREKKRFLDYYLKGTENGMKSVPRVRYSVREGDYREKIYSAGDYPLKNSIRRKFYLDNESGGLKEVQASEGKEGYISDDRIFTHTFKEDAKVVGGMTLMAYVSVEKSDDADLFVGIRKYDRKGEEVYFDGIDTHRGHVASGWLRVSQRKVDWKRGDSDRIYLAHDEVQRVKPGEIVQVFVEILPSGTLFKKGETLALVISDRDLKGAGKLRHTSVNKGKPLLYTGPGYDSYLEIPTIR